MIGSINKKIKNIRFSNLDHRPRKVCCAVKVDELVMIKFEDGTFWFSGAKPHEYYYTQRNWWFTDKMLKALRVLKIINTDDINEHLVQCKKNDDFHNREQDRQSLERLAAANHFGISKEQWDKLKFNERPK